MYRCKEFPMKKYAIHAILLVFVNFFSGLPIHAQENLDNLIREGIENNLALKQKETSYAESLAALKEAKGLFFPNLSLNARYSVSEGGRTIDLPIGDLLNPVYAGLNQLMQQNLYPSVDNLSFMFLRPQEHETKIRVIQPILSTDIYYNSKIKQDLVGTQKISIDQYKQELITEIKKAWYQVGMADRIWKMLKETRPLLLENVRVNQKLIENNKLTQDYLLRSQTELAKFDQQVLEAEKNRELANAYLNFLLNRPLQAYNDVGDPGTLPELPQSLETLQDWAQGNRQELKLIRQWDKISSQQISMNKAHALPDIMLVADYGFQGDKYRFNKESDFGQASAILSWNLFSGMQNRSKIEQSLLQKEGLEEQAEELEKSIELEVLSVFTNLQKDAANLDVAQSRITSARAGFHLIERRYEEGMASLIEFIDARSNLTQAEESAIIAQFQYLSDFAELERVTATNKY